ncbi:MAG: 3-mercaptopyruvate sulfurtransferase [Gemmatimonadales bacterium]
MSLALPGPLVSTEWLAGHLGDPRLKIVDGSSYLPTMARDARAEYRAGHLPGAVFWDLDLIADPDTALPHMLPRPEDAGRQIAALGISSDDLVVGYDGSGSNLSAPRIWWTLAVLGHPGAAVLDGGLVKWKAEGRALEAGDRTVAPGQFTARLRPNLVRNLEQVREAVGGDDVGLVDARATGRFEGRDPEPRPGLRSGHIPGAKSLPYGSLALADGTMLPAEEIRERFRSAGVDLAKPIVVSCGSGVSACALALGLEVAGHRDYAVYDGSWAEWGGRDDTPIATGPA